MDSTYAVIEENKKKMCVIHLLVMKCVDLLEHLTICYPYI